MIDDMQVYIANLGKYNEGELVGDWFSFPLDEEVIAERIGLNAEYEEYAIHDTDNFPMEISEYISIEELNRIYEQLEELPDYLLDDLDSFISCYGSLEELVEHKDDIILYSGCETMTDLAYYLIDEEQILGEIPSSLQNYIDYEAYGRDLDIEGTVKGWQISTATGATVSFSLGDSLGNPAVPVVMKMKKGAFTSEENPKLYKYLERGKGTVCHQ